MSQEIADRLISILHRAALDPAVWQDFVAALETSFDGAKITLHGLDVGAQGTSIVAQGDDAGTDWLSHVALTEAQPIMDWIPPQDNFAKAIALRSAPSGSRALVISLNLQRRDGGAHEARARDLMQTLATHVSHAFRVGETIAELTAKAAIGLSALPTRTAGQEACVIFLDSNRRVSWLGPPARNLMPETLQIDTLGRLHFTLPALQNWMETIAQEKHDRTMPQQYPFRLGRRAWLARAAFWTGDAPRSISFPNSLLPRQKEQPWLVIELAPQLERGKQGMLAIEFLLTQAEADVALLLSEGLSTDEIAKARNSSVFTVRNQLKSIANKLSAPNRTEIVRRVLATIGKS